MAPSADSKTTNSSDSGPSTTSPASTGKGSLLSRYAALFLNRTDLVLRWTVAGGRAHWFCSREKLTPRALDWALQGRAALGLYAVGKTGLSRFLAFDADDDKAFQGLGAMALDLARDHTVFLERSRRGGHAWLLFPPIPWQQVVEYGHHLTQRYGLQHVEQYPPSGELKGIKSPLTRHPKSKQIYALLDPQTGAIIDDPLGYLETLRPTPLPEIETPTVRYRSDPFSNVAIPEISNTPTPDPEALRLEISRYTTLRYKGAGKYVGLCPWHNDHTPSLGILGGYWRCFAGCGHGGLNSWKKIARERGIQPR